MRQRDTTDRPWSPEEVEVGMADVGEAIEAGVAAMRSLGEEAVTKKRDFKIAKARAYLDVITDPAKKAIYKTVDMRDAYVTVQVADLELAYDIALHVATTQRDALRGLQTQADLLRSAGRSHRDMRDGGGWGETNQDRERDRRDESGRRDGQRFG